MPRVRFQQVSDHLAAVREAVLLANMRRRAARVRPLSQSNAALPTRSWFCVRDILGFWKHGLLACVLSSGSLLGRTLSTKLPNLSVVLRLSCVHLYKQNLSGVVDLRAEKSCSKIALLFVHFLL